MSDVKTMAMDMIRWESNFIDFLFDCIKTTDEGSAEVKSAPRYRYLLETYAVMEASKTLIIVKGRQMFFTHFMASYYLWKLLFKDNVRLGIMNQNENDAADLLETRIRPLYERLPEGYPWPAIDFKRLTVVNEVNNSRIMAFSSTANQTRGKTFSDIWLDEFGFQMNQDQTLRAALPATKGEKAKLWIVSTPVPKSLYEELGRKELDASFEPIHRMEGVTEYRNTRGHTVLYVHHSADPGRRSQKWIDETIKQEGEMAYEIEYNLKWLLPLGKPVFPEFSRQTYTRDYRPPAEGAVLEVGFDFGGHHPAYVIGERDSINRHYLHKAVMGYDVGLDDFMDGFDHVMATEFAGHRYNLYCDPAGAAVNGQGTAPPAQVLLGQRFGKSVRSIKSSPGDRVSAMKRLMSRLIGGQPGLVVHPMLGDVLMPNGKTEAGVMIEGFETGLVYDEIRGSGGRFKLTYKKDQWFEHLFDAWGYMFIYLYPGLMPIDFEARMASREGRAEPKRRKLRR